jgi:hypothetical protein
MSRALQDQGLAHHDCVEGRSRQSCNTLGTENSVSEPFKVGVSVSKACASMVVAVNSNNQYNDSHRSKSRIGRIFRSWTIGDIILLGVESWWGYMTNTLVR